MRLNMNIGHSDMKAIVTVRKYVIYIHFLLSLIFLSFSLSRPYLKRGG